MAQKKYNIAFFGTPDIAVWVLEELFSFNIVPNLIVTNPDKPQGRKMVVTPPPVKEWALEHSVAVFQPESLTNQEDITPLTSQEWDLFVVVAYGQIMPKWLIDIPKYGTLNVHPSLLPKLRGASPIRTALLTDLSAMGVTIMLMDEKMDHGPILSQMPLHLESPVLGRKADVTLAKMGGSLLAYTIPKWIAHEIEPRAQDHTQATYSKKITKEMGELTLDPQKLPHGEKASVAYAKICAFDGWPGTFFFYKNKRIKITHAEIIDDALIIHTVIPEGKKEMAFEEYVKQL